MADDGLTAPAGSVVELLGLPGAGKSTVGRELQTWPAMTTLTRWSGPRRWSPLPVTLELTLRAPVLSAAAYLAAATRRGRTAVHLRRVSSVQRRHLVVKRRRGGAAVLDEGPVHALFVALYGTRETAVSRRLLRVVLRLLSRHVDGYLYLDTPKERCIANFRTEGRTSARFNADTPAEVLAEFRTDQTYRQILDGLRSVAPGKLTIVPTAAAAYAVLRDQASPGRSSSSGARLERLESR